MNRYLIAIFSICLALFACTKKENGLKVAATAVPHAQMLEFIKPDLHNQGIYLAILVTDDYNMPNRALAHREIDANFFQHLPFLENQIHNFGYPIESIAKVEIEPMGIYSKRWKSLQDLKNRAVITIPNDPTNEGRALLLLHEQGLITLDNPHNLHATVLNIQDNPRNLQFKEIDPAMLPRTLSEVDASVINTNYALQAGFSPLSDALALESANSPYVNVLVIHKEDEERADIRALKEALTSEKMRKFIEETYKGAVLPAF